MDECFELKNALKTAKVIAVTGQMACGKNAVCKILENNGAACVDADLLVHQAINNRNDEILCAFEPYAKEKNINIRNQDGSVNRRNLGVLLFSNPTLLEMQESFVYPEVTSLVLDFIEKNKGSLCVINATVLYKTPQLLELCDFVVFVKASFFKRFFRAKKRDKFTSKEILKRFNAQKKLLSEYQKSEKTIFVVKNNSTFEDLQKKLN